MTTTHTPCNCRVKHGPWYRHADGFPLRDTTIVYCPTHAQAPAMLANQRALWRDALPCNVDTRFETEWMLVPVAVVNEARAILLAVEG